MTEPPSRVPPPLPPPPARPVPHTPVDPLRASLQVTENTRTYPCHQCGGQLEFDIASQLLKCPNCGNTQPIVEAAGRTVGENDLATGLAATQASRLVGANGLVAATVAVDGEKEIVCQNCGGHTTFTGSLTATRCPYCATPIQRDDIQDAPSRLPVDAVLPFHVDEVQARDVVEKWINSRWFAPREFKRYKQTGSFASVYSAYFTYDAQTATDFNGERGDHYTVTVGSGEDQHTEVRTRWQYVSGQVQNAFDDVAVLANTGLDRSKVAALEPWPTQQALPFSNEYIAGHLCRTYDYDLDHCLGEAKQRMEGEINSTVRSAIGGDEQRVHGSNTNWWGMTFKHLLLPIWLLTVIYAGQPFQVYINGVTGEVQGLRPYSKVKIAFAVIVAVIVVIAALALYARAKGS